MPIAQFLVLGTFCNSITSRGFNLLPPPPCSVMVETYNQLVRYTNALKELQSLSTRTGLGVFDNVVNRIV